MLYHRMVLEPRTAYPIPAGTRYILLTVQKTVFGLDIIPEREIILPQLMENGFNLGDFRKMTPPSQYSSIYPTRHQTTCGSCVDCQTFHCLGHPSTREYSRATCADDTSDPSTRSTTYMQNINPPVQTHQPSGQIILPPAVETLEPTLTDDSSMDQIMASVFGDYSPQGNPPAHTQEPQMLDTVPSLFDESNDLISFLDHFETGLAIEQQEAPMDFTMPRMKK
ncbi:hypothetical protein TNCV_2075891 [Trichonephila clavipes]|nr:hypothetical protein TNCV_2075891 [Trichonephila clavipes]